MVFHVGFHKTGTSYLQEYIYPTASSHRILSWMECDDLFRDLLVQNKAFYDPERTRVRLDEFRKAGLPLMFSYEEFMGPLFYQESPNLQQRIERIKALGVTKIIFTIREQYALLGFDLSPVCTKGRGGPLGSVPG